MFKVSFKNNFKKVQTSNNRVTEVTLTGRVSLPEWWHFVPDHIFVWISYHPSVEFKGILAGSRNLIIVTGKSKCAEGEAFDAVVGERIAESRAKIKLYKFMCTLCSKILHHYYAMLYGNGGTAITATSPQNFPQKDCVSLTYKKYKELLSIEHQHLNDLLEEL